MSKLGMSKPVSAGQPADRWDKEHPTTIKPKKWPSKVK